MFGRMNFVSVKRMGALVALGLAIAGCTTDSAGVNRSRFDMAAGGSSDRTVVAWNGREKPGTVVIDTRERTLNLVQQGGEAIQYRVGVGRDGFQWSGRTQVARKGIWPDWTPPPQMRKRRPGLPAFMHGSPENPLGARAMYLGGSLYRIHGSNEPDTIGTAVSSGCIRMHNADVMDLYERVHVGTQVIVRR